MGTLDRRRFLGALAGIGAGAAVSTRIAGATGHSGMGGQLVFLGSYTSSGEPPGRGLELARRPGAGPELRLDHTVEGVPDASFFAFPADRRALYVTNEFERDGRLTALTLTDAAHPEILNTQASHGDATTHLSVHPSGRYLLSASYGDGSVAVHPILPDARLGEATDRVQHTGAQRQAHAHQVLTDPSGRWVLAVDLGADSVYVYRLELNTGKLTQHEQVMLPSGAGPRHLAFHPDGHAAYILGELRPEITVAAWDPGAGRLSPGEVVPTVPADSHGPHAPAEIAVSSDGRFVYASNRGENTIATFQTGAGGTTITRLGNTPTGGDWPRHFTLDPSERWVYVANQRSGTVNWLPRDPDTGRIGESAGSIEVPSVAIVAFG